MPESDVDDVAIEPETQTPKPTDEPATHRWLVLKILLLLLLLTTLAALVVFVGVPLADYLLNPPPLPPLPPPVRT